VFVHYVTLETGQCNYRYWLTIT